MNYVITQRINHKFQKMYAQVELEQRVNSRDFERLLDLAKSMGGWYAKRYHADPGGFAFEAKDAAVAFAHKAFTKEVVNGM